MIRLVKEDGESMVMAANFLKIKHSTARAIIKSFEDNGRIFETKKEKDRRELIEKLTLEKDLLRINRQE